jgi:hypothetical protein
MAVYRVIGIHSQTKLMQRFITADNEEHALDRFIQMIKKNNASQWERMGEDNVFVKLAPAGHSTF